MLWELSIPQIDELRRDLIKTGLDQMSEGLLCIGVSQGDSLVFRGPIT